MGRERMKELKGKVKEYIKNFDEPFSANDIAKSFKIQWNTAVKILLELALEGEIEVMKTTKSYVFIPKKGDRNENRQISAK